MNIFVLHEDAIEAADMYCDKHVPNIDRDWETIWLSILTILV